MRNKLPLLFLAFVLCSCHHKRQSPYKGYNYYDGDICYRYADLSITKSIITPGKTLEISITCSRMNDSVFWDSHSLWYPFSLLIPYDTLEKSTDYRSILMKCNEGDSLNFIVKKDMLEAIGFNIPCLITDSVVKINVRIIAILDSNQVTAKMQKYASVDKDKAMKEEYNLRRYIVLHKIPDSDKKGDVYFIPMVKGTGPPALEGTHVSISYRGYFMNLKTFDSIPSNDPMDFIIGSSGQVINGLETGIKKMREGDVAKIIIPSRFAYGEKGSSTGIVPPYTTLVFEVTMLKVNQTLKNN